MKTQRYKNENVNFLKTKWICWDIIFRSKGYTKNLKIRSKKNLDLQEQWISYDPS